MSATGLVAGLSLLMVSAVAALPGQGKGQGGGGRKKGGDIAVIMAFRDAAVDVDGGGIDLVTDCDPQALREAFLPSDACDRYRSDLMGAYVHGEDSVRAELFNVSGNFFLSLGSERGKGKKDVTHRELLLDLRDRFDTVPGSPFPALDGGQMGFLRVDWFYVAANVDAQDPASECTAWSIRPGFNDILDEANLARLHLEDDVNGTSGEIFRVPFEIAVCRQDAFTPTACEALVSGA